MSSLPTIAMTEEERLANMRAFEDGLPFEVSRWLTTIACHCLCIRDGLDDRDELAWCIERTLLDLSNDIRRQLNPSEPCCTAKPTSPNASTNLASDG